MPRYKITVGPLGSPALGEDKLTARPRTRDKALDVARSISLASHTDEYVWAWEGTRRDTAYGLLGESWSTIGTFHRGQPWSANDR